MAIYSTQKVKDDRQKLVEITRALSTPDRSRRAFLEGFLKLSYAIMMSRTLAPLYQYSESLTREVDDNSTVSVTHEKALNVLDKLFGFSKTDTLFTPGYGHYLFRGNVHPSTATAMRAINNACRALREGEIQPVDFIHLENFNDHFICTGSPTANTLARLIMEYRDKASDPAKGLIRVDAPILQLGYEYVLDSQYLLAETEPVIRILEGEKHLLPNWAIRDARTNVLLAPELNENKRAITDFLLISVLPNILDREAYDSGRKIVIFGGTHGQGTEAVGLLLQDATLLRRIFQSVGDTPYWQAVVTVDRIDLHTYVPLSLGRDVQWCPVEINETGLKKYFVGRFYKRKYTTGARLDKGKRTGTIESERSSALSESDQDRVGEDLSRSVPMDVLSPLDGRAAEHSSGRGEHDMQHETKQSVPDFLALLEQIKGKDEDLWETLVEGQRSAALSYIEVYGYSTDEAFQKATEDMNRTLLSGFYEEVVVARLKERGMWCIELKK